MIQIILTLALITGAMLWLAGVRTARPLFATVLAGTGAAAGWYLAPSLGVTSAPSAALVGGVVGFAAGFLMFSFAQAAILATVVGIVATGAYYAAEILPTRDGAAGTAIVRLVEARATAPTARAYSAWRIAEKEYRALPAQAQQRLIVLGAGATLIAFVVAMGFPKQATIVMTSVAGSAVMLASAGLAWRLYGTASAWPEKGSSVVILWGFLAVVGIVLQCRIGTKRADKSSETTRQAASGAALNPA